MEVIIQILKNYWQPILAAVLFILSFILQLIKKKPIDNIFDWIYKFAIQAINDSERQPVYSTNAADKAQEKLIYAVSYVCEELKALFPNIRTEFYEKVIANIIEEILTTPQKKGGKSDGEKKTNG